MDLPTIIVPPFSFSWLLRSRPFFRARRSIAFGPGLAALSRIPVAFVASGINTGNQPAFL